MSTVRYGVGLARDGVFLSLKQAIEGERWSDAKEFKPPPTTELAVACGIVVSKCLEITLQDLNILETME